MWRVWLWRGVQFVLSLAGAMALASLLVTFSRHTHGFWPFLSVFADTLTNAFKGDFGNSILNGQSALRTVSLQIPATLQLMGAGALIAFVVGIPLGIFLNASRMLRAAAPLMQIVAAAPVFCAALALIWLSVHMLHWSAPWQTNAMAGSAAASGGAWQDMLRGLALPALTVGAAGIACVQVALRRKAAVTLAAPYRVGLRMMGLSAFEIDLRYVLPELLGALMASLGEIALALFSASAVAEWVFNRQGAAVLFLKSSASQDWTVAALVLLIFAAIKILADFIGAAATRLLVPADAAT
jgi:peptide/nickel transport system permease protein